MADAKTKTGPWVIRVVATGRGNNRCSTRQLVYVADNRKTWDGGWYGAIGPATKTFVRKANAERWLRERPEVEGAVEVDPRAGREARS